MNKAFVKEPEPEEPRCPLPEGCGGIGTSVALATVESQLRAGHGLSLPNNLYYCSSADCSLAYYNPYGFKIPAAMLIQQTYPKDLAGPICPCLGVTAEEIRREAEAGERAKVREVVQYCQSEKADCARRSPTGSSCESEVRRLFMRHFSGS